MKNAKLIELLSKLPLDAEVVVNMGINELGNGCPAENASLESAIEGDTYVKNYYPEANEKEDKVVDVINITC